MPVSIATLMSATADIDIPIAGDVLHVTYRPGEVTPESQALAQKENEPTTTAGLLCKYVAKWDLEDGKGKVLPLDVEHVAKLPNGFIMEVLAAIADDTIPKRGKAASSSGGSFTTDDSE